MKKITAALAVMALAVGLAGRHWHEVWLDELCEWSEE